MTLTPAQMKQALTAARDLITQHSTGLMNYNKMISDEQLVEALTRVLSAVEEKV